jgi:phenylacetate-CoA ligase
MKALRHLRGTMLHLSAAVQGEYGRYRYLPQAMEVLQKSPEQLESLALERLQNLCRHAQASVPYWREVFASAGFDVNELRDPKQLEALPVLTKDIIRARGEDMLSERFEKRKLVHRATGGSTGEPLEFFIDKRCFELQHAINLRSFCQLGLPIGVGVAKVWGYGRSFEKFNPVTGFALGRTFHDAFDTSDRAIELWLRTLRQTKPQLIYGYAGAIAALSRFAAKPGGRPLESLRYVCVTAEKLLPEARHEIEQGFGVPVIDLYGCHETIRLAHECPAGSMHVDSDGALLEFLPDDRVEGASRILLTSLLSEGMPLIRYDVGDYGAPRQGTCKCGQPFPMMSIDLGKLHHIFTLTGGHKVHTTVFTKELYQLRELKAFQVVQTHVHRVELLAVPYPGRGDAAEKGLAAAARTLSRKLPGVTVEHKLVEEIPKTIRGKQPYVVSLVSKE